MSVVTLIGCQSVRTAPERGSEEVIPKGVLPVTSERNVPGTSGVLLTYEIRGGERVVGSSGCRMRVLNRETRSSVFLDIKQNEAAVFEPLEPGAYEVTRIGCGIGRIWDLNDLYKSGFQVQSGRVSYLGKLIFVFKSGKLDVVLKGTRLDSMQSFSSVQAVIPVGYGPMISGFSGLPITDEMVQGEIRDGFDVFIQGTRNPDGHLDPLLENLKECASRENSRDPLRFGQLEYVALYRDGRFASFKSQVDKNALSTDMRGCIQDAMQKFRPYGDESEIQVRY